MPKRRANGEGNIRKRKDGRWEGRYTAGYDANGKAITKNVLGKTQAEVKDKLRAAIEDSKKLDPVKAGSYTLEQWLKLWYSVYVEPQVRYSTREFYHNAIDHHIIPKLGSVKLEKLANATMRDRVGKGDYDIAIGNWSPDFADPYMFMNYWFESDKKGLPGNRSFYENSEVDKLLRNALATTDQTQRTRDYQQAQKIVIDDAAYVYLFQKNYQLAMNKEVKGFVFNPMLEQVFNINTMSK